MEAENRRGSPREDTPTAEPVGEFFDRLGGTVEERWRRVDFHEDRFPEIAFEALREAPPHARFGPPDVVRWLATAEHLPYQARLEKGFGQPPLTLFWNGRFQIDVLFWITETTAIHQHGFGGAFTVLGGSSVHSNYVFETRRKVSSRFALGRLRLAHVELLERGALRRIERGSSLIHSLFHLEAPSVTVVVRTCTDPEVGPEYSYLAPTVAMDPSHRDPLRTRQVQIVEMLARTRSELLEPIATEILSRCDLHTAFLVLLEITGGGAAADLFRRLVARCRVRWGDEVDDLVPALEEERRRALVFNLRRTVVDPDLRFFLALLLNLPDRPSIDRLVRSRHPRADPADLVEAWSLELARSGALPGFEADESLARLLGGCVRGLDVERIVDLLEADFPGGGVRRQRSQITEACRRIRSHPMLRPLFLAGDGQPLETAAGDPAHG